jgi:hypothetical protein
LVGSQSGLESERRYVTRVLPVGVLRHLAAAAHGDSAGLSRAALVVVGLLVTGIGYVTTRPVAA